LNSRLKTGADWNSVKSTCNNFKIVAINLKLYLIKSMVAMQCLIT